MNMLKEIGLLTLRQLRAASRNPVFLFMGVMTPLMYLALFAPLLKTFAANGSLPTKNILDLFVPGMLPIIAFSTGLFTGFGLIDELRSGVIERFRVTPSSRFAILSGFVCYDVCATLFQSALFILIALPFGFRINIAGLALLLLFLILLAIITSSVGNAIAMHVKSEDRYAPIVHGINLPLMLLSGSLLPISLAPLWLKVIAHFNPIYYVVEASRSLALGELWTSSVLYSFLILVGFCAFTLNWATNVFSKAVM